MSEAQSTESRSMIWLIGALGDVCVELNRKWDERSRTAGMMGLGELRPVYIDGRSTVEQMAAIHARTHPPDCKCLLFSERTTTVTFPHGGSMVRPGGPVPCYSCATCPSGIVDDDYGLIWLRCPACMDVPDDNRPVCHEPRRFNLRPKVTTRPSPGQLELFRGPLGIPDRAEQSLTWPAMADSSVGNGMETNNDE